MQMPIPVETGLKSQPASTPRYLSYDSVSSDLTNYDTEDHNTPPFLWANRIIGATSQATAATSQVTATSEASLRTDLAASCTEAAELKLKIAALEQNDIQFKRNMEHQTKDIRRLILLTISLEY